MRKQVVSITDLKTADVADYVSCLTMLRDRLSALLILFSTVKYIILYLNKKYVYRVIIGGNFVRLSKESGMQKTRLISLD